MKVIEGEHLGSRARVRHHLLKGPTLQILGKKDYRLPKDVAVFKLMGKDESRTAGQVIVCLLLAVSIIGLPIALLLLLIWRNIAFTVAVKAKDGAKFVVQGDAADWKLAKKFVGIGVLEDL